MKGILKNGALRTFEYQKDVVLTEKPTATSGFYYEEGWEDNGEEIVQTWTLVELPDEVDDAEAFNIIFGGEA